MSEFLRSLEQIVEPKHSAILVIDMQNDFCSPGGVMHRENQKLDLIQGMIPNLKYFLRQARESKVRIVFFQNTHDDKHVNVANLELDHRKNRLPQRTIVGTWGWEVISDLLPDEGDRIFPKYRYSAFTNESFRSYLRDEGICSLMVTGVGTAVCVESTVRDAFMADYYVVVPKDCVAAYSIDVHEFSLRIMDRNFARVVTSQDIIDCWASMSKKVG